MKNVVKFRIILWLSLVIIIGWLLYVAVVPSGRISYTYDFIEENYFIRKLTPAERVELPGAGTQKIIGDPVYFSLRTPRRFNQAKVTFIYKNEGDLPLLEAGVLVDKTVWRYDLKPLENRIMDQLAMVWDVSSEDSVMFLQREKKFASAEEFLADLNSASSSVNKNEIAVYNYNLEFNFILPDYASSSKEQVFAYPLRGSYQFYVYIKDEPLNFIFSVKDLNRNLDPDPVAIRLYYRNRLLMSRDLADDNNKTDNGQISAGRVLELREAHLPEGVYKLEIKTTDDIITESITTTQQQLSFINKLWLASSTQKNIIISSDSRAIHAKTVNPSSLQEIKAGSQTLTLEETYKQYSLRAATSAYAINIAKGDVILGGDGVFQFGGVKPLNPGIVKVNENIDINGLGINYIIARYRSPEHNYAWRQATAEFNLASAYREDGQYSFIISIPGLRAEDEVDDWIEFGEIKVELAGKSLGERIREMIGRE